jgi:FkbH-like protein
MNTNPMVFVFRNNTIERFFPKCYDFSGYGDISNTPVDAEGYVWFYQLPVKYDQGVLAEEIGDYSRKLGLVLSQIDNAKQVVALTMEWMYAVTFTDDDHRLRSAIEDYNASLYALAKRHANLKVIDFGEFTRQYSAQELTDWKFYLTSQMVLNPALRKAFWGWFSKKMDDIALKRKKCLVIDLDNTLWGGVLGEEGINGIQTGSDYPGTAFHLFQEGLLELSKHGVILTVCSKNDEDAVFDVWERNPFLVLRKEHFVAWRINWKDKATNIKEIAKELNIGLDSMVFVDDDPRERELIRQQLPIVEVPDFPVQPYELPVFFQKLVNDYFKVYSITQEDREKTQQYKDNASRIQAQQDFCCFKDYLKSLDIHLTIEKADEYNMLRIAQMTQKTNQFNLTTKRYTDGDVRRFLNEGWMIWCLSVADRFGDNGITGCMMVKPTPDPSQKGRVFEIDTFLLSCRIMGKDIEYAFVRQVLAIMKCQDVRTVIASYIPTAKNRQTAEFYDKCGFTLESEHGGVKYYALSLDDADITTEDYYQIVVK